MRALFRKSLSCAILVSQTTFECFNIRNIILFFTCFSQKQPNRKQNVKAEHRDDIDWLSLCSFTFTFQSI